ncbi:MAG: hypothetical protein DMG06_30955 [Acidobacteria bacterium]|nr:MAG: hypothetical protein DMG06_30955 [Acidobacteriota bacterium]
MEEASRSPHFPASGAESSAAGWKVEEAPTIEGAPALKHGANENAEQEFSPLFCIVYLDHAHRLPANLNSLLERPDLSTGPIH